MFSLILVVLSAAAGLAADAPLVGVCWYKKSGMAERVLKGFSEEMKKRGDPVRLAVKANLPDADAAKAAIATFLTEGAKGVVCLRSDGAKLLVEAKLPVPGFIGAAGNPIELGVCTDPAAPDKNITGVTYYLPADPVFGIYRQIWPEFKKVGLLVQKGHPGAPIEIAAVKAWCAANGATLQAEECAEKATLAKVLSTMRDNADLIIGGNQGLLIDNGQLVGQVAGKTPYVSFAEKPVTDRHALLGVVPDDEKLGRQLAAAVIAVVIEGKPVAQVAITEDAAPRLLVNGAKAKAAGITIPAALNATVLE
jgi:putative ABC transport system substrate-binding protein